MTLEVHFFHTFFYITSTIYLYHQKTNKILLSKSATRDSLTVLAVQVRAVRSYPFAKKVHIKK